MQRALTIIESMCLVSIVCVFDQAIYSKACEIKWKEPHIFQNCLLITRILYFLTNYMGILKKQFYEAGMNVVLL